jgi:hypothetical protein
MFETIEEAPIVFMFQGLSGAQEYTSAHYQQLKSCTSSWDHGANFSFLTADSCILMYAKKVS